MNFSQFALSKFGNYVERHDYIDMRKKLRSSHIFKPYEEYVSCAILVSLIIGIIGAIIGVLIGMILIFRVPGFLVMVSKIQIVKTIFANQAIINSSFFNILYPYKNYITIGITVSIISIILFIFFFLITYSIYMLYPSLQNNVRKVKIDTMLPNVLMYMYSLSRGETNVVEIIKSVADIPNIYGEVSNEFAMILRDMEFLGIDFVQALRNVQRETPSENFNQFLGNLITIIDNGGEITDFFAVQIENYRTQKRSDHAIYLDLLSMTAEGYVTGFVAGPLFLIVTGVTLGAMKSSMTGLLIGLTYVVLPLGSIVFIVLIDIMLPKDEQEIGMMKLRRTKEFIGIRTTKDDSEKEKNLFQEYEKSKIRIRKENILKDPLKAFFEEPALSLYISIPVAFLIVLIPILLNREVFFSGYVPASVYITDYIFYAILVAIIPYIIFFEIHHRKLWKIESSIPQFLKNLSIINDTGLSLTESLRIMLRTEKGTLRTYIEGMYTDISWGASVVDAFTRFANKIRVNSLSRVVALVTKASETSGDIRQILDIVATDANINIQLRKDKSTNMLIYIIIIYITFAVFLYIIYTLTATFLPQMANAQKAAGSTFIQGFDLGWNKVYFFHTALIQAFFSGTMAGVLGEGDFRLGLKHSVIMLTIAFLLFKLLVGI